MTNTSPGPRDLRRDLRARVLRRKAEIAKGADVEQAAPGSLSRALAEWRARLRTCVSSRPLRVILMFGFITAMGEGIMGTLFAPFVRDDRDREPLETPGDLTAGAAARE